MRPEAPFQPDDLAALERLFYAADAVVPMRDIAAGDLSPDVIGLRHDVDNVIEPAVRFAEWEADRGIRATYFILHGNGQDGHYWHDKPLLRRSLERIAELGHEIGFHCNAVAQAIRDGGTPTVIALQALAELRGYGFDIVGTVAHGDQLCHQHGFVNDELFVESARPEYGPAERTIGPVHLAPMPRAAFGLGYDANWLSRGLYLSDSGGRWSPPGFDETADRFPGGGQLHMLVHPDWWAEAFAAEAVAA